MALLMIHGSGGGHDQGMAWDPLIRHVLATPPGQVAAAGEDERARVNDLADRILPVSRRAQGLRDEMRLGKSLVPCPLETIRVPTLVVSAKDDDFGTNAGAQSTANRIPGARFIGLDDGGHLLVQHPGATSPYLSFTKVGNPPRHGGLRLAAPPNALKRTDRYRRRRCKTRSRPSG